MSGRGNVFWEEEVAKKRRIRSEKERGKKVPVEKLTIGQKIRGFNILFPWFKVSATVMLAMVVVFGVLGAVRHNRVALEVVGQSVEEGDRETGHEMVERKEGDGVEPENDAEHNRGRVYAKSKPVGVATVRVPQEKKLIALTFDDGPALATVRLLDILKEKKVRATFFVIGKLAQEAPELLQREEREGHVVGSHTMGHVNLATLGMEGVEQDASGIDGVFQEILGRTTGLTRPPYGAINEAVKIGVDEPLIIWSIDPEDWRTKDATAVRKHVVEKAFDGAIVLMHDIYDSTVEAVAGMIDDLRAAGYEFVTVPEMARIRGVRLEKGEVYGSFRP